MMEPVTKIPKDRKILNIARICLLIGMTALLLLVVSQRLAVAGQGL